MNSNHKEQILNNAMNCSTNKSTCIRRAISLMEEREIRIIKRIKEEIDNWMRDLGIFESAELVNIPDVMVLVNKINEIAGDDLI